MTRLTLVAVLAAFGSLLLADPASPLTRTEANRIAVGVLKPELLDGDVILFGLRKPLRATQSVVEAGPSRLGYVPRKKGQRPLGKKAWLFWEDLAPYSGFEHQSVLLLLDDARGRVLHKQHLSWYPLIDGGLPAFLRTSEGYESTRYVVFSHNEPPFSYLSPPPARPRAPAGVPGTEFVSDCLILIGPKADEKFRGDLEGMQELAQGLGLPSYWVTQGPAPPSTTEPPAGDTPGGPDLATDVTYLVEHTACEDVFIYVTGHGVKEGGAEVVVGEGKWVVWDLLARVFREHPAVTFKLVVDACFSGRFVNRADDEKEQLPNLLVVAASSRHDETSKSRIPDEWGEEAGARREVANTAGRGEFTHSLIVGMTKFIQDATEVARAREKGGSFLARAVFRGFVLGAQSDLARRLGYTSPQIGLYLDSRADPRISDVDLWWDHVNGSKVCGEAKAPAGVSGEIQVTGARGYYEPAAFTIAPSGILRFFSTIGFAGLYAVTFEEQNGAVSTFDVRVPGPAVPGPKPCPTPPG